VEDKQLAGLGLDLHFKVGEARSATGFHLGEVKQRRDHAIARVAHRTLAPIGERLIGVRVAVVALALLVMDHLQLLGVLSRQPNQVSHAFHNRLDCLVLVVAEPRKVVGPTLATST
jgi:hypothetical protein